MANHVYVLAVLWVAMIAPASGELVRVVVVARHGNREPNPQVPWVCPNAQHLSEQFKEPLNTHQRASLSRVGKAENWESGNFLRETYKEALYGDKDAPWQDNGMFFAFSERMNRNIVSMEALLYGLFPEGTGEEQFLASRPNLVPYLTSTPFHDTLINTPRDGPCKLKYSGDLKKWNKKNSQRVIDDNKEVLEAFGKQCGFDFINSKEAIGKPFTWGIKAACDAFSMARNEGIDVTDGGKFNEDTINAATKVAQQVTNDARFGEKHQITYWLGRFVEDALFANLQDPGDDKKASWRTVGFKSNAKNPWQGTPKDFWNQLKMLVFLNHRELMMSLSKLFGYEQLLETPLKAGSMIIYELHKENGEEFIITKAWNPSQPDWAKKHAMLKEGNILDLYEHGTVETVTPGACGGKDRCTLKELKDAYKSWTEETGTWKEVCDYPSSAADNVELEEWDDDESFSRASDAEVQTMAHAAEPTSFVQEGPSTKTFACLVCAFAAAVAVSFLAGIRFSRNRAVTSDEILLG